MPESKFSLPITLLVHEDGKRRILAANHDGNAVVGDDQRERRKDGRYKGLCEIGERDLSKL